MQFLTAVLDLFFPRKCVFCKKILHVAETEYCEKCIETLPYTEFGSKFVGEYFDFCVSPLYYKGVVRKSLARFKFNNAPIHAEALGKMLAESIKEHPDMWTVGTSPPQLIYDFITWVPLSRKRKQIRGYDQAKLLATETAKRLDSECVETLIKSTDVKPQSDISEAADRRANVDGVYEIIDSTFVENKCILVIDDIITTGSTLSECAKVLLDAGANRVICACMARSE